MFSLLRADGQLSVGTMGYDDEGAGDALLFVHGHPFDRSMWRGQVERFAAAGWRTLAPDLRGYGPGVPEVRDRTTLDVFAHDLAGLLDDLGIGRAVLCGLSMGGQVVLEFHRLFSERVRGLVLADTSAAADGPDARAARRALADRLPREGMAGYADEVLPRMVAPRNIAALPAVADHVLGMMRRTAPDGAAAALRGRADRPDYVADLPGIAVPTLVVVGSEDDFTPVPDARLIADAVPGAELVVVEGAAHLPNLERPAEFDAALGAFLAALPTPA
jgi:pimeloyl-ACP methyl ester carboxylesterase